MKVKKERKKKVRKQGGTSIQKNKYKVGKGIFQGEGAGKILKSSGLTTLYRKISISFLVSVIFWILGGGWNKKKLGGANVSMPPLWETQKNEKGKTMGKEHENLLTSLIILLIVTNKKSKWYSVIYLLRHV